MTKFGYKLRCSLKKLICTIKSTTLTKQINMATYFENLIVELHEILKMHVKFHANQMLFTS